MKKGGIIHPELMFQLASCGHGDLICIADAGLPIPPETPRVDLGFVPGRPGFFEVLDAMLAEMCVEGAVWAGEAEEKSPEVRERLEELFGDSGSAIPHEEFKDLLLDARFVVRTGEFTPYANVLLRCGVPF
ncbi:MAG: D-ribose pyranase [Synergistaceae bacterium]|nr:D-ribose pyranase [Synergistota bacterium]NLM70541.1 D-ribose pyranase [Synergistaceae bacterium]